MEDNPSKCTPSVVVCALRLGADVLWLRNHLRQIHKLLVRYACTRLFRLLRAQDARGPVSPRVGVLANHINDRSYHCVTFQPLYQQHCPLFNIFVRLLLSLNRLQFHHFLYQL